MPIRRQFLLMTGLVVAGLVPAAGLRAQTADQATAFIRQTGNAMAAIANGPGSTAERQNQIGNIVEHAVDVDGVARFALGRFWRQATPEQQKEYLLLFHHVLAIALGAHLGEYRGVAFTINRAAPAEGGMAVDTTVTRPNAAPADVQWIVADVGGQPKIIDVIAEGTSMRLTQRSDYSSYLSRNGNSVAALIAALRRQAGSASG
jgi:phospholipid transport system substrate-binding protein